VAIERDADREEAHVEIAVPAGLLAQRRHAVLEPNGAAVDAVADAVELRD
jgi:hypothetical protein